MHKAQQRANQEIQGERQKFSSANSRKRSKKNLPPDPAAAARAMRIRRGGSRRLRRRRGLRRRKILRRIPRSVCPPSKLLRVVVVDGYSTTTTVNTVTDSQEVSRLNIVNPTTNSLNQPLGYDQWKNFYQRAKVLGIRITFTVHNAGTQAIVFGITPVPENQAFTDATWPTLAEQPGTKYRILSQDVDHGVLTYTGSTKKFFKIKDIKDAEEISCDIASDSGPSRDGVVVVWWAKHNADDANTVAVNYIIKTEYIVLLDQPINPARSQT